MKGQGLAFFTLLRAGLGFDAPALSEMSALTSSQIDSLYALAKAHDLAHIVTGAIENGALLPSKETAEKLERQRMIAIYRYERLQYEYERIKEALESAGIDYMPLKGAVIRALYPEPWMRTSCDIDLLVREDDLKRAIAALTPLGLQNPPTYEYHDVALTLESGIFLELHFSIKENIRSMDGVLARVWDHAVRENGHRYVQSREFLIFYTIAHAAYHFVSGGCGVRPLLDLFLLTRDSFDEALLASLLRDASLLTFAENARALAEVWFGAGAHTPLTREMESYILAAGVYGTIDNRVAIGGGRGGRVRYFFSRVFLPYGRLKAAYPSLAKCPLLFPFYQVRRWFRILFKRRDLAVKTFKHTATVSPERSEKLTAMCRSLELLS